MSPGLAPGFPGSTPTPGRSPPGRPPGRSSPGRMPSPGRGLLSGSAGKVDAISPGSGRPMPEMLPIGRSFRNAAAAPPVGSPVAIPPLGATGRVIGRAAPANPPPPVGKLRKFWISRVDGLPRPATESLPPGRGLGTGRLLVPGRWVPGRLEMVPLPGRLTVPPEPGRGPGVGKFPN